jgi:hypothetical protein
MAGKMAAVMGVIMNGLMEAVTVLCSVGMKVAGRGNTMAVLTVQVDPLATDSAW